MAPDKGMRRVVEIERRTKKEEKKGKIDSKEKLDIKKRAGRGKPRAGKVKFDKPLVFSQFNIGEVFSDEEEKEAMGFFNCVLEATSHGIPPQLASGCQGELRCPTCPLKCDVIN